MDNLSKTGGVTVFSFSDEAVESVPGLPEWLALERWRVSWRPTDDPLTNSPELTTLFQHVQARGYAAYGQGVREMPELFACYSLFAIMWQIGYDNARLDELFGHQAWYSTPQEVCNARC